MMKLPRRAYFLASFSLVMLCLTLLQLLSVSAAHAPFLNLDFETAVRNLPFSWSSSGSGFDFSLDTANHHSGACSLRIESLAAVPNTLATASESFPIELVRGKRVRVSGWIKTANVKTGAVGLWWRVDGAKEAISLDNAPPPGMPPGNMDWTRYQFERDISDAATAIWWGVFFRGEGTAWFDDLQISIDGMPIDQGPPPSIGEPTKAEIAWIRKQAIPIADDLRPLKGLIGDARIVALGEATHGTSEFFEMKRRIVEFLAGDMGFTIFAMEANMPEAYRLNRYVVSGEGDPEELLKGLYFWTWNTQEVLDMIRWMRQFNESGKGHIEFNGFDMQTPAMAMDVVRDFSRMHDSADMVAEVNRAIGLTTNFSAAAIAWKEVVEDLEALHRQFLSNGVAPREVEWAIQNARIAMQSMQMQSKQASRDNSMARNLQWIGNQSPNSKIVVWAHNGHVNRQRGAMGSFLAEWYGKKYLPIEFAFHDGNYNAVGATGLGSYESSPSFPGSAEYFFHLSGIARFALDLRKASSEDRASAWILGDIQYRNIGAMVIDGFAPRTDLTKYSDAVIFVDHSTPSALLPF